MSGSAPSVSRMPIRNALNTVDEILRGQHTTDAALATGTIAVPTRTLVKVCAVLGAVYGRPWGPSR